MSDELAQLGFNHLWAVDFEFVSDAGERPVPVCLVAKNILSGELIREWVDDFATGPSYPVGPDAVVLAYMATAELSCHLALGWRMPVHILDLYVEFRRLTNGRSLPAGRGLLGALAYYGLDSITAIEKDSMRDLILSGGPYSASERIQILDYCQTDVDALDRLWSAMSGDIGATGATNA